ncbi:trafficking protein particle complex subunit 5 [Pancytospora epiphaga]|nr:trafficking protein particle complex subunit 5 [Pancytospora epiphaga]
MGYPMRETFMKYIWMAAWEQIPDDRPNIEEEMKKIGYDMGKLLIILKGFRQESTIEALLFKIAYNLLPGLYQSERYVEKSTEEDGAFLLSETTPIMNSYISLPEEHSTFSCDSITAGIIEAVLMASGFSTEVTAHNAGTPTEPNKNIYLIKQKVEEEDVLTEKKTFSS